MKCFRTKVILAIKKTRCQSCKTTSVTQQPVVCRHNFLIIVSRSWVRSSILTATVYRFDWRCMPVIWTPTNSHNHLIITRHLRELYVCSRVNRWAILWLATKECLHLEGTSPWTLTTSCLKRLKVFQKAVPTLTIYQSSNRISRISSSMEAAEALQLPLTNLHSLEHPPTRIDLHSSEAAKMSRGRLCEPIRNA